MDPQQRVGVYALERTSFMGKRRKETERRASRKEHGVRVQRKKDGTNTRQVRFGKRDDVPARNWLALKSVPWDGFWPKRTICWSDT